MPSLFRPLFALFVASVFSLTVLASDAGDCANGTNLEQVQCIAKRIRLLDIELNGIYQRALAAMPERDNQDTRKQREQLRKAQRAWLKFKDENCALVGGLEGGNNLSVAHLGALCEEKEIKNRIKFLKGIADGSDKL